MGPMFAVFVPEKHRQKLRRSRGRVGAGVKEESATTEHVQHVYTSPQRGQELSDNGMSNTRGFPYPQATNGEPQPANADPETSTRIGVLRSTAGRELERRFNVIEREHDARRPWRPTTVLDNGLQTVSSRDPTRYPPAMNVPDGSPMDDPNRPRITPFVITKLVEYYAPSGVQEFRMRVPEGRLYS